MLGSIEDLTVASEHHRKRASEWREAVAASREAHASLTTFRAAYGPSTPDFEAMEEARVDTVVAADTAICQKPAFDLASFADKVEIGARYIALTGAEWVREGIVADARRLAEHAHRFWPPLH